MSGLYDQAEVGRKGTTVTGTSGLLVGVWSRQVIGKFSGALEHLSIVVGTVGIFDFLCQSSCLIDGMGHANQVAPGNAVEGVASSTNLAVDLEATTDAMECVSEDKAGETAVRTYLAWSNVSNQPLCGQGYAAEWRPSSASEFAWTSPMKGRVPYRWVYHAIEPAEKSETEMSDAREVSRD